MAFSLSARPFMHKLSAAWDAYVSLATTWPKPGTTGEILASTKEGRAADLFM